MTRKTKIFLLISILSLLGLAALALVPEAGAQTTCAPIAYVRVIAELNASIRTSPEVPDDNRNRIGNLTYESGEKAVWEFRNGFYHLCEKSAKNEEQWVSATYNGGRNSLLTVRLVSTVTPTPRPTTGIVTPTRIPSATPGPTPTKRANVWVSFSDGTLFQCDVPCTFTIYDTLPTREPQ